MRGPRRTDVSTDEKTVVVEALQTYSAVPGREKNFNESTIRVQIVVAIGAVVVEDVLHCVAEDLIIVVDFSHAKCFEPMHFPVRRVNI